MFGQKKKKSEPQIETNLNRVVTPMLDMTFQILFFLIMNFRLPTPEGQVDLFLPQEESGGQSASTDALDQVDDEYSLRVRVFGQPGDERQGTIAALSWIPKKAESETINPSADAGNEKDEYFQKLDPLMYGLVRHLKQYQPKEGGKQPTIKIEFDKKLRYSELLRIMDVCRKMKFQKIGVMPIPKGKE